MRFPHATYLPLYRQSVILERETGVRLAVRRWMAGGSQDFDSGTRTTSSKYPIPGITYWHKIDRLNTVRHDQDGEHVRRPGRRRSFEDIPGCQDLGLHPPCPLFKLPGAHCQYRVFTHVANDRAACIIESVITRREFILLIGGSVLAQTRTDPEIAAAPNFCSHEHWGSIDSIGTFPGGYRADFEQGAKPKYDTTLLHLLLDPYLRGVLLSSGTDRNILARRDDWSASSALRSALREHQFNGIYQCTRRGIQSLYGLDILNLDSAAYSGLASVINRNYKEPFVWYRKAMAKAHFSELIRPVHPEFYRQQESPASAREEAFMRTVMRIDPFLDFWTLSAERRKSLSGLSDLEPADAKSWRAFLAYWFEQAQQNRAVGIKQLQAYRRDLDFQPRTDNDINDWTGVSSPEARRKLQDWILHECCKQANDRGWAHQVHVGTHNLPNSSPLPLASLARRYPRMKIVMIHCWPFLEEAGTLARQNPNIYIDTCWQPILNPAFFRAAISQWWNYVPSGKITCGHDATTVEMAVGSSLFTREILSGIVQEQKSGLGLPARELIRAARNMLHGNAVRIYGYGSDMAE